jgi:hypothetical protein
MKRHKNTVKSIEMKKENMEKIGKIVKSLNPRNLSWENFVKEIRKNPRKYIKTDNKI